MKKKITSDLDLKEIYAKAITKPTKLQAQQRGYDLESIIENC